MTSEEQARAIATQIADRAMMPSEFAEPLDARDALISDIEAALRTREAETWAQAAQECERISHRVRDCGGSEYPFWLSAASALRLRARAAQPQKVEQ